MKRSEWKRLQALGARQRRIAEKALKAQETAARIEKMLDLQRPRRSRVCSSMSGSESYAVADNIRRTGYLGI